MAKRLFKGINYHLIPLFCTVSANVPLASMLTTKISNEIKDLAPLLQVAEREKSFEIKHLAKAVKVMLEAIASARRIRACKGGHGFRQRKLDTGGYRLPMPKNLFSISLDMPPWRAT
jgi:hypothetical protein